MLFKLDHTMRFCLENRVDLIPLLQLSDRQYSWYKGEDIGQTLDNFAVANPKALLGDFRDWTKRTYPERYKAHRDGVKFDNYTLQVVEDTQPVGRQTKPLPPLEKKPGVTTIDDAVKSQPRRAEPRTDLKKVAEPGQEPPENGAEPADSGTPNADNAQDEGKSAFDRLTGRA